MRGLWCFRMEGSGRVRSLDDIRYGITRELPGVPLYKLYG